MARIVEFIETDEVRGKGTPESVMRRVRQLWTKDGSLIAEFDVCGQSWYVERNDPANPRNELLNG